MIIGRSSDYDWRSICWLFHDHRLLYILIIIWLCGDHLNIIWWTFRHYLIVMQWVYDDHLLIILYHCVKYCGEDYGVTWRKPRQACPSHCTLDLWDECGSRLTILSKKALIPSYATPVGDNIHRKINYSKGSPAIKKR